MGDKHWVHRVEENADETVNKVPTAMAALIVEPTVRSIPGLRLPRRSRRRLRLDTSLGGFSIPGAFRSVFDAGQTAMVTIGADDGCNPALHGSWFAFPPSPMTKVAGLGNAATLEIGFAVPSAVAVGMMLLVVSHGPLLTSSRRRYASERPGRVRRGSRDSHPATRAEGWWS